jgi:hypothetical protein
MGPAIYPRIEGNEVTEPINIERTLNNQSMNESIKKQKEP